MIDTERKKLEETLDLIYSRFHGRNTAVITKEDFDTFVTSFMYLRAYKDMGDKQ